jgi:hypothetical protein
MASSDGQTRAPRVRLFHPERLFGELVAVMVRGAERRGTEYGLIIDWATGSAAGAGEYVKFGGLVNQMRAWARSGVVVGVMGQSGAGLQTPWALQPVPESQRGQVVALLDSEPVKGWARAALTGG